MIISIYVFFKIKSVEHKNGVGFFLFSAFSILDVKSVMWWALMKAHESLLGPLLEIGQTLVFKVAQNVEHLLSPNSAALKIFESSKDNKYSILLTICLKNSFYILTNFVYFVDFPAIKDGKKENTKFSIWYRTCFIN